MSKKIIIAALLALFIISASGTVFAVQDNSVVGYDDTEYRTNGWNWKDVGYDQKAPTGSGNCKLQVPGHKIYVVGNPVTKSGSANEWYIDATQFDDSKAPVSFGLFYQLAYTSKDAKGKEKTNTESYLTYFTVNAKATKLFDLRAHMKELHYIAGFNGHSKNEQLSREVANSAEIKSVALGPGFPCNKQPIYCLKPVWGQKEVPYMKVTWDPKMVPEMIPLMIPEMVPKMIDEEVDKFDYFKEVPTYFTSENSVTATVDANNPTKVANSNHFTLAKLTRAQLEAGITLDLVVGNKYTFLGTVFVGLENGKIVLDFGDDLTGTIQAIALNYEPKPSNGNIHSGSNAWSNDIIKGKVLDCPPDDDIYLYVHIDNYRKFDKLVEVAIEESEFNENDPSHIKRWVGKEKTGNLILCPEGTLEWTGEMIACPEGTLEWTGEMIPCPTGKKIMVLVPDVFFIPWIIDWEDDFDKIRGYTFCDCRMCTAKA